MPHIQNATIADIPLIQQLAEETWWPTYSSIVSAEQIRYMLDLIYSTESLTQVMTDGSQQFVILYDDNRAQAFAAYGPYDKDEVKLHKLYVLPQTHGKGYGRLLVEEIKTRLRANGIQTLTLNVNRYNKARDFYEKIGFTVTQEVDVAVGPYWMNDYVMALPL